MNMREYGFLSPYPIVSLKPPYDHLSKLVQGLPELIAAGTQVLRREIRNIPLFDVRHGREKELRALMREYHFLQNAYVHSDPEDKIVPTTISVPSFLLAESLSRVRYRVPPVLSYSSAVLDNWMLIDVLAPFSLENFRPIVTFTGARDEEGFFAVHLSIEQRAGKVHDELILLKKELRWDDFSMVSTRLCMITQTLKEMIADLSCMRKQCDPLFYYEKIRPWLMPFKDVVLKGIARYDDLPQSFPGASGAQSSVLPMLDAALGIRHRNNFAHKMRDHMVVDHRALIERLEEGPSVREYVSYRRRDQTLVEAYDACVCSVDAFRKIHMGFAMHYVHAHNGEQGTGGTPYKDLLEQYTRDTEAALI